MKRWHSTVATAFIPYDIIPDTQITPEALEDALKNWVEENPGMRFEMADGGARIFIELDKLPASPVTIVEAAEAPNVTYSIAVERMQPIWQFDELFGYPVVLRDDMPEIGDIKLGGPLIE